YILVPFFFFFSSRRRHTRWPRDWSSDVCSSDLLLAGLETPTAGQLLHRGQVISEPDVDRSLIFQQPSLYPWLSALDNVAFGLKLRGVPRAERHRQAEEFLRQVGLREFARKHPHELSGGMQQRVAIARALCVGADTLLMDEPFA